MRDSIKSGVILGVNRQQNYGNPVERNMDTLTQSKKDFSSKVKQFFVEEDFNTISLKKFYEVISQIVKDVSITDIEILENDFVRCGVLKNLRIFKPATKFDSSEVKEILALIAPEKFKTIDGDLKYLPVCFSFSVVQKGHFRVTVMLTRAGILITMRRLSYIVPDWNVIGVPVFLKDIFLSSAGVTEKTSDKKYTMSGTYKGGFILITGPMGSGKTTTMASMIKLISDSLATKILTIENPVEYVHLSSKGIITQMEVGTHVDTQEEALVHALRSNASVICLGEVRTAEEIFHLLQAGEMGCFSMATFHVPDAVSALERICFELHSDVAIRVLASTLIGVVNQRLFCVEDIDGSIKFHLVVEWLPVRGVKPIQDFLMSKKFGDIRMGLERKFWAKEGAISMDTSLKNLVARGVISPEMYEKFKSSIIASREVYG